MLALEKVFREVLSKEGTFELKPEGREVLSYLGQEGHSMFLRGAVQNSPPPSGPPQVPPSPEPQRGLSCEKAPCGRSASICASHDCVIPPASPWPWPCTCTSMFQVCEALLVKSKTHLMK